MEKIQRRGTVREILSLPNAPYSTTALRGKSDQEEAYFRKCMELCDAEKKRLGPSYHVRMRVKNGIPYFTAYKQSVSDRTLRRRITRSLSTIRGDVVSNKPKQKIISKIDRALERVEDVLWEE